MKKQILKVRNFRTDDTLWSKIGKEAKRKRISVSLMIRHIIEDYFGGKR